MLQASKLLAQGIPGILKYTRQPYIIIRPYNRVEVQHHDKGIQHNQKPHKAVWPGTSNCLQVENHALLCPASAGFQIMLQHLAISLEYAHAFGAAAAMRQLHKIKPTLLSNHS